MSAVDRVDSRACERKPTLKPPVVEILIFTEKTQMFQINGDLDVCVRSTLHRHYLVNLV